MGQGYPATAPSHAGSSTEAVGPVRIDWVDTRRDVVVTAKRFFARVPNATLTLAAAVLACGVLAWAGREIFKEVTQTSRAPGVPYAAEEPIDPTTLSADVGHSDATRVGCRDGGLTQVEMNTCASERAQAADKRLAALVAELDPDVESRGAESLASIQRRWVELRDLDCKWEQSSFRGGSIAPMLYANCLSDHTEQRINRLSMFLCEGRGLTGPCAASQKYSSPK
jgi:uncharacterized protein YecT (DUF1311 family)